MQKNNNKIVVFIGKLASGKGYESQKLVDKGYKKISFADPLREMAWKLLKYKPENYDNFKKRLIYLDKFPDFASKVFGKINKDWTDGRSFLQKTGDVFKIDNKLFWTNKAIECVDRNISNRNIVIDDCRFRHELVALQQYSAKNNINLEIYFTDYRSEGYEMHSSHGSEMFAEWLRDCVKLKHLDKITVDKCFYYRHNGIRYKTPVEIKSVSFLDERDILKKDKYNMFDEIVSKYEGE